MRLKKIVVSVIAFFVLAAGSFTTTVDASSKSALEADIKKKAKETAEYNKNWSNKLDQKAIDQALKDMGVSKKEITGMAKKKKKDRVGAVLVTTDTGASLGKLVGHAGIIHPDSKLRYTVESYPKKGVQRHKNNWTSRYKHLKKMYVKKASKKQYTKAANYAKKQIGKPYNYFFADKKTSKKFYCSQLVWRAWKNASGKDLDHDGGPSVWPVDLIRSKHTVAYYSK
ncbi:YiiX/YebB-like N1pC/P60 family cysteine hydrolase [Numidum massiliense]|uniref:YiiX/YebB-like N1pC/P60 family cysteine hydrolase n=1 Tax=Numidum massiliense TaxID=1522315 RepID=UPI0006D570BB|nr:YiiX/YebB-like N1pC/P60 family cysteine hydrolase [Numidum massiliense]